MATTGLNANLTYGGTAVPNLISLSAPQIQVDDIDITTLSSDAKESMASPLIDNGEITFECQFDEAVYATLVGIIGDTVAWVVEFPDETNDIGGSGYLKSVETEFKGDELTVIKGTVKTTGEWA